MRTDGNKPYIPIIGTHFGFPVGMAATQRATRIAELVAGADYTTEVLIARPTELAKCIRNTSDQGIHKGVAYRYPGGKVQTSASRLIRFVDVVASLWATAKYLREKKPAAIIIYSRYTPYLRLLICFLRRSQVPLIFEVCEWPVTQIAASMNTGYFSALNAVDYGKVIRKHATGAISISSYITNQLSSVGLTRDAVFELPVLMGGADPIHVSQDSGSAGPIVFCGSLIYWDEVRVLIDAIVILKQKNVNITVHFYFGSSYSGVAQSKFDNYVLMQGVGGSVQAFGFVEYNALQEALSSAQSLVCLLREADVSRARFPNKMAEYLLTGNPVIATNIGEVGRYLVDGVSAFLVAPDSAKSVSLAIERVLDSPKFARQVGSDGKQLAEKSFSVGAYTVAFSNYLENSIIRNERKV